MYGLSGQTKRDILSFILTFLIYLSLFLLWRYYATVFAAPSSQPTAKIVLDLQDFVKEVQPTDIPELEKEEEPEEREPSREEKPVEKEPVQKEPIEEKPIIEEPLPEPVVKPEPIEPIPEKPKAVVSKKPKIEKKKTQKVVRKKRQKKKKSTLSQKKQISGASKRGKERGRSSSRGRSQFVARLRAKINANKSYPRIARKRRMQGSVKVKFRITSTGKLSGLTASGPRIFVGSAKRAVKSAFPVSTRDAALPMSVSLTLNYRLKK